jgi:spore germination protein GerM
VTPSRVFAALSLAVALLSAPACRRGDDGRKTEATPEAPTAPAEGKTAREAEPPALDRTEVTVYFPSASGDGLAGEPREIFTTPLPGDRAKQILSDLISGPATDATLPAVPAGTRLRQVYVLADGTAYADFSAELTSGSGGGSAAEVQSVYAIVNSVTLNVPEIVRLGILVEGRTCETLAGHLDLTRPLRPDRTLIETPPPAEAAPREAEPSNEGEPPSAPTGEPIQA